ncbi:MAG: serine protease [Candidatus Omnitrophica bacterium]|nr:serine protease [Candidatus Omnitrophota bacterium]
MKQIRTNFKFAFKISLANFIILVIFANNSFSNDITDEAKDLYIEHRNSVYQIQIVNNATGKKSTIGSGFQISKDGHIVTNFHVVSSAIHSPEDYRVEFIRSDDTIGSAQILDIDVVHDIAIIKSDPNESSFFHLRNSDIEKGTKIFSMGNPHDLGMTIVEGTYNGLMKESLYKKILFSGSLNPGMSGGPAFNRKGEIIGINVSTAGNQISFLVPVEFLSELFKVAKTKSVTKSLSWDAVIERQLSKNQNDYFNKILSSNWNNLSIGNVEVPGELTSAFKCWGNTPEVQYTLFKSADIFCSNEDVLYLSSNLWTGEMLFRYKWMYSTGLSTFRFYNLYENQFKEKYDYPNAKKKSDVTNFKCQTEFVNINGMDWKIGLCSRNYKKYRSLYDINLSMSSVGEKMEGLIVELVALGVNKTKALDFIYKFIGNIKWQK